MRRAIVFALGLVGLLAAPAAAQMVGQDQTFGQPGYFQFTTTDGHTVKVPAYVPLRGDGTPANSGAGSGSTSATPSYTSSVAQSYPLLNNGTATPATNVSGGTYGVDAGVDQAAVGGTIGGTSVVIEQQNQVTGQWSTVETCAAAQLALVNGCPAAGPITQGTTVRARTVGGAPSGISVKIEGVGGPAILPPYDTNERAAGYNASGKTFTPTTLTAAGVSPSFVPLAGRGFHAVIPPGTGTNAATCYIEDQLDGTNWYIETYGGQPTRGPISYTGASIDEYVSNATAGVAYRWNCGGGTVVRGSFTSGSIAPGFVQ